MKAIRIFFRSIRDSFKNVLRNFSLSMASVLCTTITLIIVAVSIIVAVNINYATNEIEDDMNIVVYAKSGTDKENLDKKSVTNKNLAEANKYLYEKNLVLEEENSDLKDQSIDIKDIKVYYKKDNSNRMSCPEIQGRNGRGIQK